jgi:Tfp pilus assembly protein PilO
MTGRLLRRYSGQSAFLGMAIGLVVSAAVLSTVGWRAFRDFSDQAIRYRTYKAMQRDAGKADSLSEAYAGILKDMQAIRLALPAQNQSSHVLNQLVEGARKMELGIVGINALDEVPFAGYSELPFEVSLSGGFPNLVRYLHSLETQGMVLQVRRLTAESEAMNRAKVKAKLELSVFVPGNGRVHASADSAKAPSQEGPQQ